MGDKRKPANLGALLFFYFLLDYFQLEISQIKIFFSPFSGDIARIELKLLRRVQ